MYLHKVIVVCKAQPCGKSQANTFFSLVIIAEMAKMVTSERKRNSSLKQEADVWAQTQKMFFFVLFFFLFLLFFFVHLFETCRNKFPIDLRTMFQRIFCVG